MPNEPVMHKKHIARLERERQQSRLILYSFIFIVVAVIGLIGYALIDQTYLQLKRPVAKIGETKISVENFQARVRLYRQQLLGQYNIYYQYQQFGLNVQSQLDQISSLLNAPEEIGQTVLDQMVNEELIRQEAAKRGITASPQKVEEAIQSQFNYFPNGSPTPTVTPTENPLLAMPSATPSLTPEVPYTATAAPTLEGTPAAEATAVPSATATLAPTATEAPSATPTLSATFTPSPTATPYTLEGYQQSYKDANDSLAKLGFKYDVYQNIFEMQLLQEELMKVIAADAKPAEEQVHARHILVNDEALAKEIIARLQNGENFGLLASQYSSDASNAAKGGDLGWFGKGAMVAEFEAAAFNLKNPGDFTLTPVKTQFGYHIIQLIERGYSPDQIKAAQDQALSDWLAQAKIDYGVETYDIWKQYIPTTPSFESMATEAAQKQLTAVAEEKNATATPVK
ncbi:MAG: hypothetical protein Fur002_08760 [Anaerolineales bacterium]